MSMPAGSQFVHGYATAEMGYREISEFMTELGDKMNHSTARNVFLNAMVKISKGVQSAMGELSDIDSLDIAKDPRFQSAIEAYLKEA